MKESHHASCTPRDRDLVWHCSQCGLDETAPAFNSIEDPEAFVKAVKELHAAAVESCLVPRKPNRLEDAVLVIQKLYDCDN